MKFTCSTNIKFVPNSDTHPVNNIVLDHRNENIIILHNDTFLFVLEKIKVMKFQFKKIINLLYMIKLFIIRFLYTIFTE